MIRPDVPKLIAEARSMVEGHAPTPPEVVAYRLADALEEIRDLCYEVDIETNEALQDWLVGRIIDVVGPKPEPHDPGSSS